MDRVTLHDFNDIPTPKAEKQRHSWIPQSLITLAQNPPEPPTIGQLLYPGKRTLLSGETESLKTWLALILTKAEIQADYPVAWVDLDDMGAGALLHRLQALGLTNEQIHDQFMYYQPDQMLYANRENRRSEILTDVVMQLATIQTRFMVIDAFNPFLSLHGLDMNSNTDIETVWREIAKPISDTGTCVCLLDHVVKTAESRGKYSSGSERKASGSQVHIGLHTLTQLTVGGTGKAVLTTHKDRPAFLPRPSIGILELTSKTAGDRETIAYKLTADTSHTPDGFRPTTLMEKISRRLEHEPEPVNMKWVEDNVTGKRDAIRTAITLLVQDGYLNQEIGPRSTRLLTTSNPYRAGEDAPPDDLAPTSPHLAPRTGQFGVSTTSPPPSSLTGEGEVDRATTGNGATSPQAVLAPEQNGLPTNIEDLVFDAFLDTQPEPTEDE